MPGTSDRKDANWSGRRLLACAGWAECAANDEQRAEHDRMRGSLMARKTPELLTAWANAQGAVCEFWLGTLLPLAPANRLRAWSRMSGTFVDAVSASAKAALETQVALARVCAESVAADPRSSKLVVEGAHQAYDLVAAYSEASAATFDASLALARFAEPALEAVPTKPAGTERE